ncbi:MAG TPA: hypothetical protein VMT62_06875 [Syntrophorhabdaceae bacterium]|nr:hypothetical protein [Syntrophorhabdaceae bacterium]
MKKAFVVIVIGVFLGLGLFSGTLYARAGGHGGFHSGGHFYGGGHFGGYYGPRVHYAPYYGPHYGWGYPVYAYGPIWVPGYWTQVCDAWGCRPVWVPGYYR